MSLLGAAMMTRIYILLCWIVLLGVIPDDGYSQSDPSFNAWVTGLMSEDTRIRDHGKDYSLTYTEKWLTVRSRVKPGGSGFSTSRSYTPPQELRIASAGFKADDKNKILLVLSNGVMILIQIIPLDEGQFEMVEIPRLPANSLFSNASKIIGDALYILKQGKVYVSRDTAKTWEIDSVHIGKLYVSDISVDTNYYAWVTTDDGVFYQHPDSNLWRKAAPLPAAFQNGYSIFADRRNRIFVSRPFQVLMSTDRGSSWNDISTGTTQTITAFGDDAFGNIYGVGYEKAFRLSNGTPPWTSIGDSINAQSYLPSNTKIINSISGDSILYAATKFGVFQSKDLGVNWVHAGDTAQVRSHIFYTRVVKAGNYFFVANNLGIYRVLSGDSTWKKVFPKVGFISGINVLSADSAGNVYGNFPVKTGPTTSLFLTMRSTDLGDTWVPDTAGFKTLGINAGTQSYDLFVDKQGMQYLGGNGVLYSKKPGHVWKRDTVGIGLKSGEYIADVSLNNRKGSIYLCRRIGTFPAYSIGLYRRSIGDTIWQVINTSHLAATEGRMISDHEGNIVIRTLSGSYKIWRYDGTTWTEVLLPSGIGSSPFALHLTVDHAGVLWGAFVGSGQNKGVYWSTNNGTSWKYAGLNGVGIKFLTAVEESTSTFMKSSGSPSSAVYATSFIDGMFRFTTASAPTSIESDNHEIAHSFELHQNYPNPFNPSTSITFTLPMRAAVKLSVYDMLGREVSVLVNEERNAGTYTVPFNAAPFSSGVYFCRMKTAGFTSSRKLLLQK